MEITLRNAATSVQRANVRVLLLQELGDTGRRMMARSYLDDLISVHLPGFSGDSCTGCASCTGSFHNDNNNIDQHHL